MTEIAMDIMSWILLMAGSLFAVVGGIGLLRLRDFFSRMHAGGMTDTMGAGLILTGLMFQTGLAVQAHFLIFHAENNFFEALQAGIPPSRILTSGAPKYLRTQ